MPVHTESKPMGHSHIVVEEFKSDQNFATHISEKEDICMCFYCSKILYLYYISVMKVSKDMKNFRVISYLSWPLGLKYCKSFNMQ